ncbi:MAG TPA: TonB-dependent receptor [Pyrinomonadaceae bacterium]|nr:TonB-dependent receptor [Pyrinomonadaceae bacterium]
MKRFMLAVLAMCAFTALAVAQGTGGRLVGTVAGPDGNIPGATITAKDNQTGKEQTAQASEDGSFNIPQLEAGTYTVTVTAQGFKTFNTSNLKIDVGRDYTLNATLEVGNINETVEVVAGADVINASNGELSTAVTPRQVRELPINGRNPLSLLNLIAGSNPTSSSINGQRSSSVNYTRDGLNVQDNFIRNGFVSDQPTVDDTGEFTVITQNAGAEYGTGSTQVVLVTPRGGADFHGNLFAFNRNSVFAANNFFNNLNNVPRAFLNRNQFGGTISGPVTVPRFGEGGPTFLRGKAFFFANYEGFRLANQVPISTTTLLPTARNGTFSYLDNTPVASGGPVLRTVNVLTGTGLTNPIPATAGGVLGVDPTIQSRIINNLPTSGNGALTGINFLQTVAFQRSNPENRDAITGRFDVDFNDTNSFNFIYKRNKNSDARTDIGAGFSSGTFVTQGGPTTLFVAAYRMSPTAAFSNEIRGGYQRSEPFFNATNDPRNLPFLLTIPLVTNPEPSFQSQGRNTDYFNIQDNASYTRGNHSLRFGAQGQYYRIQALNNAGVTPTYALGTTGNTATPGLAAGLFPGGINTTDLARANSLRYLLGGVVGGGTQTVNAVSQTSGFVAGANSVRQLNFNNYAAYISDQWRVSQRLTLNFGLRYELYTPLNNPQGLYLEPVVPNGADPIATILNPVGSFQFIGGNAGNPGDFFKADKNNFGPNISFAYTPNFTNRFLGSLLPGEGRTVLRGGYRVNYVNDEYVRAPDNASLNNSGLGSTTANARFGGAANGATQFRVIGPANAPTLAPIVVPPSAFTSVNTGRTFQQNNAETGVNFGTISLVDPNFQVQRNYEYNLGIQREVGFQSVIEIRYVGGYSKELTRSIDYNQVDIRKNGFLPDFLRAQSNLALVEARRTEIINANPNATNAQLAVLLAPFPVSAAQNANVAGSQALTVFPNLASGGLLTNATILTQIRNGVPADLAVIYLQNSLQGDVKFVANPNSGVVNFTTNGGRYNYNSLQAEFRRRFTGGLALQANYTFQKILTNVTGSTDEVNQTRVEPFLDNENPQLDYARAIYDRAHTFNFNGQYELPFGNGKRFFNQGGVVNRLIGGFQISSIINISSGVPTTITDARGTLNRAGRSANQPATSSLSGDQIKELFGVFKTPNGVFVINPSALFATATNNATGQTMSGFDLNQPLPPGFNIVSVRGANPVGTAPFAGQVFFPNQAGSTGNLARNFLNGPVYINWDAGLLKNIGITENTRLQLRAEVFNVLNRANFFSGNLDVGSTNFGRLTGSGNAYAPRIVQFGARFEF